MTAGAAFSGFALVSLAICFSGASSGDFISTCQKSEPLLVCIKFRSVPGVLLQYVAREKFLLTLRQLFQFIDDFFQPKMFREPQWPTSERRKTGSQNHSVVCILG